MGTVEEEADETIYWMELLIEAGTVKGSGISDLLEEGNEILSIVVISIKTARGFMRPIRSPQSAIRNLKSDERLGSTKHDAGDWAAGGC